jgi:hypothetical protein
MQSAFLLFIAFCCGTSLGFLIGAGWRAGFAQAEEARLTSIIAYQRRRLTSLAQQLDDTATDLTEEQEA